MAMSSVALKDELLKVGLHTAEDTAAVAWTNAWFAYFSDAESNGNKILVPGLTPIFALFQCNLAGFNDPGNAANQIQIAMNKWWNYIQSTPATIFPGCTAITKPPNVPLAPLYDALNNAFDRNVSTPNDTDKSYDNIAFAMHYHNIQPPGMATFPGPVVAPIL